MPSSKQKSKQPRRRDNAELRGLDPVEVDLMTSMPHDKSDKDSAVGQAAIAEFNAVVGYDIRQAWTESCWWIAIGSDGRPDIALNRQGVRAMARFAPRPDACEIVEEMFAQIDGAQR